MALAYRNDAVNAVFYPNGTYDDYAQLLVAMQTTWGNTIAQTPTRKRYVINLSFYYGSVETLLLIQKVMGANEIRQTTHHADGSFWQMVWEPGNASRPAKKCRCVRTPITKA